MLPLALAKVKVPSNVASPRLMVRTSPSANAWFPAVVRVATLPVRALLVTAAPNDGPVKSPPATMLVPSKVRARTVALAPAPGLKLASRVPSGLRRANRLALAPLTLVKSPPITIFPSADCTSSACTRLLAPTRPLRKVGSRVPSAFRRTTFCRADTVKLPARSTLPSACTATARTGPPTAGGVKVRSSVPSAFSRATRLRTVPLTLLKLPPMTTLPTLAEKSGLALASRATALTAASAPAPTLRNVGSSVPSALRRRTRPRAVPL